MAIVAETLRALRAAAEPSYRPMIEFAQRAVQTRSLPGEEGAMAALLTAELQRVGCDDVWQDGAGNILGVYRGSGSGKSVQLNSHIDHVAEGDPALWERPPYAGIIEQDTLYGRAASDVKGGLAPQVYAIETLRRAGLRPAADLYVVGVVLEEVGGLGTEFLCQTNPTDIAVLSEATNNGLRRGHRGRALVEVSFIGRSVHASVPDAGISPYFSLARFLLALKELPLQSSPTFGGSSVAPTLIRTDQESGNVTPGTITLSLDWRTVPGETESDVVRAVSDLARAACDAGVTSEVQVAGRAVRTYTGLEKVMPATRGYELPLDHPVLLTAKDALGAVTGGDVPVDVWNFATDGGHLMHYGIPTIGYSPCEERFAHTIHDQISLSKMREALVGNAALALALTAAEF